MHYLAMIVPMVAIVLIGSIGFAYAHGCQGHGLYCHAGNMPPGTWWWKTEVASATILIGVTMFLAVFALHYYLHVKKNKLFSVR